MPRSLRIEYEGARYHVTNRGDAREAIFYDESDRTAFLETLGQACAKTGWQVHAWCLMANHFHLVVETAQPNLAAGMKWLLGTYTQRFNRKHQRWGHLFGGRYKAQLIDERSPGYLRRACDYVHLNPARAQMVAPETPVHSYRWSSYPKCRQHHLRPNWLRVDRLLGEYGLGEDTHGARREFERALEQVRLQPGDEEALRKGWTIGAEDFCDRLADKLARAGRKGERASGRSETDEALAEHMVLEALEKLRWSELDLAQKSKGDRAKVSIAHQLRSRTPMTREWIGARLRMGSASYVSNLLSSVDSKL